ncbi:MAG: hypothetical protein D6719_13900 [Candidatus Dadabacteria bacterium]|nr:MAG: hypothetical protein D6719_13900 [Candidatus Dadabacteria bacterium]
MPSKLELWLRNLERKLTSIEKELEGKEDEINCSAGEDFTEKPFKPWMIVAFPLFGAVATGFLISIINYLVELIGFSVTKGGFISLATTLVITFFVWIPAVAMLISPQKTHKLTGALTLAALAAVIYFLKIS